jgi:soluble lytic murein transglycosylase
MNNKTQLRRTVAILLIICISIGGGILVNELWNVIEQKLHPRDYSEIISAASEEFDIPEYIIYATIKVESDFDPNAVSSAGAIGLMQMIPSTFEWLTGPQHLDENLSTKSLDDPKVNIRYGTYYLSYLYKKFDYNWDNTFAAYNGGETNVASWLKDPQYSDLKGNLTNIPLKETENYVKKINKEIDIYRELYPEITEMN